ncbi:YbbR-like domain-containing protein [Spirochaeta thermophila]|uniref:Membrane associated protein n=1 Tax=Winmispira thermophila (strain ATCC 49972 / DSM 6192 / RI 19.B1) TaxID=665571 RepID=E0RPI9_WINT6|nr:CdaR family protein [Spirochaeta thermophila]ADN02771.1 membrane associated protein [Spirochaeta thermophila DSM 6192]
MRTKRNVFHHLPAKIVSLVFAVLLFYAQRYSAFEERYVMISLSARLPETLIPASPLPEKVRVGIRGREEDIYALLPEDLSVYVDLSSHTVPGRYTVPIHLDRGESALGVEAEFSIEPSQITVELVEKLSKSLQVIPDVAGSPPPGYEVVQMLVIPSSVEVEGPRDVIEGVTQIRTERIDLSSRTEDASLTVRLVRPAPSVRIPGGDVVEVRVLVRERIIHQTFEKVPLVAVDLSPSLEMEGLPEEGSVTIQGPYSTMEGLAPQDVHLVVDCAEVEEPGEYVLEVRPIVPQEVVVLDFSPRQVGVRVRFRESPATGVVSEEGE